jgi:hypothetical protein
MAEAKVRIKPNKFNEIFNSANRFVAYNKADNPFLKKKEVRVISTKKSAVRESAGAAQAASK